MSSINKLTLRLTTNQTVDGYGVEWEYTAAASKAPRHLLSGPTPLMVDFAEFRAHYDPVVYGRALSAVVFASSAAKQFFAECLAASAGATLRVVLEIEPAAAALHDLHWETLCDPESDMPLFLGERLWLTRFVASGDRRMVVLQPKGMLTAAAMVASPEGLEQFRLPPIDVKGEIGRLRTDLGVVPLRVEPLASLAGLKTLLREHPTFLQVVCHGTMKGEDFWLLLADEQGKVKPVKGAAIVKSLNELQTLPLLVLLVACEGAGRQTGAVFRSLGVQLVQAGVPAVIAMQGSLTMETAKRLLPVFFAELQKDGQIDRALAVARGAVRERPDFWMPVLFSRLTEGRLWAVEAQAAVPPPLGGSSVFGQHGQVVEGAQINIAGDAHLQFSSAPTIPPALLAGRTGGIDVKKLTPRPIEVQHCQNLLAMHHWLILQGFAGMGKASLAAMLAQLALEAGMGLVYEFTAHKKLDELIEALANFLYEQGQRELWEQFSRGDAKGLSAGQRLAKVLEALCQKPYWLCLLNLQHLTEDAERKTLLMHLAWALERGQLRVILTSEQPIPEPRWAAARYKLPGMTVAILQEWLTREALAPDLAPALHKATDGNPLLAAWALEALRTSDAPEELLAYLVNQPDVEGFLLDTVEHGLKPEERQVLQALGVLSEPSVSWEALEAVLLTRGLRPVVGALAHRYLIDAEPTRKGQSVVYRLNPVVRAYYYRTLDNQELQHKHQLAAHYYETSSTEKHLGLAAWHYWKGANAQKAATLILEAFEGLVNQGQTARLRELLEGIDQNALEVGQWPAMCLLCGYLRHLYGELPAARQAFAQAFWTLRNKALPNRARLLGKLGHYAGLVRLNQAPRRALHWFVRGLAWLREASDTALEQAQLQLRVGMAQRELGQLEIAHQYLAAALTHLPNKADQAVASLNLGIVYCVQGSLELGLKHYREAEALYHVLGDSWGEMEAWHNLGYDLDIAGRWGEAATYYEREVTQAKKLNDTISQFYARLGLGVLYTKMGQMDKAEASLQEAVDLSKMVWETHHIYPLSSLVNLYLQLGRWAETTIWLDEVDALAATRTEPPGELLSQIHRNRALWHLQQGQLAAARAKIEKALEVAKVEGYSVEEGINERVLGEVLAAAQDPTARQAFEASHAILLQMGVPYEAARTQLAYGRWLQNRGEVEAAAQLLAAARTTFEKLGAAGELA